MIAARLSALVRMAHKVICPDGSHLGSRDRIPARSRAFVYAFIMIGTKPQTWSLCVAWSQRTRHNR
jgi:hypothetical protein